MPRANLKTIQAKLASRYVGAPQAAKLLQDEAFIVPALVQDMGKLIGTIADAMKIDVPFSEYNSQYLDIYCSLSEGTALLLSHYGIEKVEKEFYDALRYSKSSPGHVTLLSRVDRLHRAWATEEPEHTRQEAQRLWATLEDRCQDLTGKPFSELIG